MRVIGKIKTITRIVVTSMIRKNTSGERSDSPRSNEQQRKE